MTKDIQLGVRCSTPTKAQLQEAARLDRRDLGPWLLELGVARAEELGVPEGFEPAPPPSLRRVQPRVAKRVKR